MNETYLVKDVLADESHDAHAALKGLMEKLDSGELSFCGCMGPMYGEPYCPCQMKQKGLQAEMDANPERQAEQKRWEEFWANGGMSGLYEED